MVEFVLGYVLLSGFLGACTTIWWANRVEGQGIPKDIPLMHVLDVHAPGFLFDLKEYRTSGEVVFLCIDKGMMAETNRIVSEDMAAHSQAPGGNSIAEWKDAYANTKESVQADYDIMLPRILYALGIPEDADPRYIKQCIDQHLRQLDLGSRLKENKDWKARSDHWLELMRDRSNRFPKPLGIRMVKRMVQEVDPERTEIEADLPEGMETFKAEYHFYPDSRFFQTTNWK